MKIDPEKSKHRRGEPKSRELHAAARQFRNAEINGMRGKWLHIAIKQERKIKEK